MPVAAIVGEVYDGLDSRIEVVSLVERFGAERAWSATLDCIEEATATTLASRARP